MGRGLGSGPLGSMPLGGAFPTVAGMAAQPSADVFRRLMIKRRVSATGLYESDWQDVSRFVKNWGSVERSIDDIRLNMFRNSGLNIVVRNDTGAWNDESNINSLFFGYLTRYRTLVRLDAGYIDSNDVETPLTPTLGIFLMDQELPQRGNSNDIHVPCSSLQQIFQEVRASDIGGILGVTQTASDIVAKIRDHTDGAGSFVFRQLITSTSWTIETTTTQLVLDENDLGKQTWDLMADLAFSERKVLNLTRLGGIEFRSRSARTSTAAFAFYGQGFSRPNVIRLDDFREAWDKFYTFFRLKYLDPDTTTSYVQSGTQTVVNPSNVAWKYGSRPHPDIKDKEFIPNTATAQSIVDGLLTDFGTDVPKEATWTAKIVPDLEVLDRVTNSYHSYELAGLALWDAVRWGEFNWATEGQNFDWDDKPFKAISIKHNVDDFTTQVKGGAL